MNIKTFEWKLLNQWLLNNISYQNYFQEYEISYVDELGFEITEHDTFDGEEVFVVHFKKLHDCHVYIRVLTFNDGTLVNIQVLNTQEGKMSWENVTEDSGPFWYTAMNLPMPKY